MSPQEIGERLVALEAHLLALRDTLTRESADLRKDLKALHETIHGPPYERSLRGRMHTLETSEATAKAAQAALDAARALQDQQGQRRFTHRERVALVVTAVVGAGCAVGTFVLALVAVLT